MISIVIHQLRNKRRSAPTADSAAPREEDGSCILAPDEREAGEDERKRYERMIREKERETEKERERERERETERERRIDRYLII